MPDVVVTDWITAVSALLAILGWAAAATPTPHDDTVVARLRHLWRLIGGRK